MPTAPHQQLLLVGHFLLVGGRLRLSGLGGSHATLQQQGRWGEVCRLALAGWHRPRRQRRSKAGARPLSPASCIARSLAADQAIRCQLDGGWPAAREHRGRTGGGAALAAAPLRQQVHCRRPLPQALTSTRATPAATAAAPLAASLNDAAHTTARGARALRWAARGAVPARKMAVEVCIAAAGGLGLLSDGLDAERGCGYLGRGLAVPGTAAMSDQGRRWGRERPMATLDRWGRGSAPAGPLHRPWSPPAHSPRIVRRACTMWGPGGSVASTRTLYRAGRRRPPLAAAALVAVLPPDPVPMPNYWQR